MSELTRKPNKQDYINRVMDVLDGWDNENLPSFVRDLMSCLSGRQLAYVEKCLNYNTPIEWDIAMAQGAEADLEVEIERLKGCAISGFYEDEVPQFHQGHPTHEIEELVTAAEVTRYVSEIEHLTRRVHRLEDYAGVVNG